ncbi:uncharacterized protein J3D65DRAFT_139842 [Phyllosticta citribraziliensis]|uniref:Uncharacterized protein n=1 Tax=Phyllosticta citribraziliensis TaxID=989973 RepID=A0ABR1L8B1_9PEZI
MDGAKELPLSRQTALVSIVSLTTHFKETCQRHGAPTSSTHPTSDIFTSYILSVEETTNHLHQPGQAPFPQLRARVTTHSSLSHPSAPANQLATAPRHLRPAFPPFSPFDRSLFQCRRRERRARHAVGTGNPATRPDSRKSPGDAGGDQQRPMSARICMYVWCVMYVAVRHAHPATPPCREHPACLSRRPSSLSKCRPCVFVASPTWAGQPFVSAMCASQVGRQDWTVQYLTTSRQAQLACAP